MEDDDLSLYVLIMQLYPIKHKDISNSKLFKHITLFSYTFIKVSIKLENIYLVHRKE